MERRIIYYEEILRKYVFDNNNALSVSADSNAHIPIIQREPFDVGVYEIFAEVVPGDV